MNFQIISKVILSVILLFVSVSFAQTKEDSIPLPSGCTDHIKMVSPLCDFNHDGSIDLWVVGASCYRFSNIPWSVSWYGIYSLADKTYLYSKSFEDISVTSIHEISATPIDSNTIVLFNGTILSYGNGTTSQQLKKK